MGTLLRNTTPLVRGRAHSLSVCLPRMKKTALWHCICSISSARAVKGETWDCHGNKVRFLREQLVRF